MAKKVESVKTKNTKTTVKPAVEEKHAVLTKSKVVSKAPATKPVQTKNVPLKPTKPVAKKVEEEKKHVIKVEVKRAEKPVQQPAKKPELKPVPKPIPKQGKTLLELDEVLVGKLSAATLILVRNINDAVCKMAKMEASKNYTNDFLKDVNNILDNFELVLDLLSSSMDELLFGDRNKILSLYRRLFSKRSSVVERANIAHEFNKEETYVNSLCYRNNFMNDYVCDKLIELGKKISSKTTLTKDLYKEIKPLLLELFSLSIYNNSLKQLVNDVVSYKIQNIDNKMILTLR